MSAPLQSPLSTSTSRLESPYTRALLAGGLAGTTVDLSLYPIDTLKTRLQSSASFRASGGFSGIYAGVGSALVGSAPGAALFFVSYEATKHLLYSPPSSTSSLQAHNNGAFGTWTEPLSHMAAASVGEIAACAVRVPTEVVKQRAQALQQPSSMAAVREILARRRRQGRGQGWRGVGRELYRGWGVTVMREVPFTVIQFPLWEGMKGWYRRRRRGRGEKDEGREEDGHREMGEVEVGAVASGLFGSVAGAVAAGVTTPLDVMKTRLMLARGESERVGVVVRRMVREEGVGVFFRGVGLRVVWISVGGAVFLGSYQWGCNALGGG